MTVPAEADPLPARAFRFGLGPAGLGGWQPGPALGADHWRRVAERAEDLGYHAVCFGDHLDSRPSPGPLALMVTQWTDRLRGAVHVHANDFRHPGVLARDLATMAMLSGGRLDAGLGAGWMPDDYRHLGIPFDPPATRLARLADAARVVKAVWDQPAAIVDGDWYQVDGLPGRDLLGGAPRPRLVMGGGGPRMLALAAAEADIVSVNVALDAGRLGPERGRTATAVATDRKLDVVRQAAGDRFDDLILQVELHVVEITDDRPAALRRAATALGLGIEDADASPHVVVGSVDDICDQLKERRDRLGLSYVCLSADHAEQFAPVVARLAGT